MIGGVSGSLSLLSSLGSLGLEGSSSLGMSISISLLLELSLLGSEWVKSVHDSSVSQWVLLGLVVDSDVSAGLSELGLNLVGVDNSGKVSDFHDGSVEVVVRLLGGSSGVGTEYCVEGLESGSSEDDESSKVTTWGELKDVQSVDIAGVNTGKVSGGSLDAVIIVVDNEWSLSENVLRVSVLSSSGSSVSVRSNLGEVFSGTKTIEGGQKRLGVWLVEVVNNKRELGNRVDEVTSGHHERSASGSSEGGGNGVSSLGDVDLSVPSSPDLERGEHSTLSAHVTESGLSGS